METITQVTIELYKLHIKFTSSTAQGGGGSFKNSKPIGEVDCCESRMAGRNPLMDRKVVGGWSCVFWSGCNGCSGHLTTTAGCGVVCSAVVVVGVVVVSVVGVVVLSCSCKVG